MFGKFGDRLLSVFVPRVTAAAKELCGVEPCGRKGWRLCCVYSGCGPCR